MCLPVPHLWLHFSGPPAVSTSIKVNLDHKTVAVPRTYRSFGVQYYWVAIATLLFYDYSLTLDDEVGALFARPVSLLTPSRFDMYGREGNHGVCLPGPERSILRI